MVRHLVLVISVIIEHVEPVLLAIDEASLDSKTVFTFLHFYFRSMGLFKSQQKQTLRFTKLVLQFSLTKKGVSAVDFHLDGGAPEDVLVVGRSDLRSCMRLESHK